MDQNEAEKYLGRKVLLKTHKSKFRGFIEQVDAERVIFRHVGSWVREAIPLEKLISITIYYHYRERFKKSKFSL